MPAADLLHPHVNPEQRRRLLRHGGLRTADKGDVVRAPAAPGRLPDARGAVVHGRDTPGRSGQTAPAWASTSPLWPTACTWPAPAWSTGWSWWKATGWRSSTAATHGTWGPARSRYPPREPNPA